MVFLCLSLLLVFSTDLGAQSQPDPCLNYFNWWFLTNGLPQGSTCYSGFAWFFVPCTIPNNKCSPTPECRHCQDHGGAPIALATGDTYIEQRDLSIPGLGGGLSLVRTWNSIWTSLSVSPTGLFGVNWRSTYEERIVVGLDGYIRFSRGDGDVWAFGWDGEEYRPVAPKNISASLVLPTGATYWTLTFQNGEQRRFDRTTGNLIAIIDRNGNTTQLSYDSSGRLVTVTDPASRYLTFSYSGGNSLITGVTASVGPSLTYTYDGQGRLTQVTKPDLTTVSFAYSGQSFLITSVTDSNGKVLESHTYDGLGRGLTSQRAGGVEAVTLTYPQ